MSTLLFYFFNLLLYAVAIGWITYLLKRITKIERVLEEINKTNKLQNETIGEQTALIKKNADMIKDVAEMSYVNTRTISIIEDAVYPYTGQSLGVAETV
ncbi:MAG: hypothetical protein J6X26_03505 [Bacteroidales bacterium]|nr:hypothetical protein [Bacteroidales bacterium]